MAGEQRVGTADRSRADLIAAIRLPPRPSDLDVLEVQLPPCATDLDVDAVLARLSPGATDLDVLRHV
jgi:hypothetical protein